MAHSPVYETEPVGVKPEHQQLKFLNAVLIVESDRTPADLHRALADIENELGRVRNEDRFAPRAIDIDILFAGKDRYNEPRLKIPHPRWAERRFVVQPLADVRANLVLPGAEKTVKEILRVLPPEPVVRLHSREW